MAREVVVNGRFLSRQITGVERHGREILSYIGSRCRVEQTRFQGWKGHAWEQFFLPTRMKSNSILWSPANSGPLWVSEQALTLHDLSPLEHPEWFKKSFAFWYRMFLPVLARKSRVIFTPSNHVRHKIVKRFGVEHVVVTPNGVDPLRFHPSARQKTQRIPEQYILFTGSLEPRKNLEAIDQAWQAVKDEFPRLWLLIAGSEGSVFAGVKRMTLGRKLYLDHVSEADLPGVYAQATLLLLPSFDEGFGLPALEAMACGVPVIVSNGGALPETVGNAGLIYDLGKPDHLPHLIRECLRDEALRRSLREKGLNRAKQFSWQNTAELIWSTLHEI